nr:hypothetical protein [Acaryochloris sp. CCMEE 5410]
MDVGNNQNSSLDRSWARTSEYAWMQANAGKYGLSCHSQRAIAKG